MHCSAKMDIFRVLAHCARVFSYSYLFILFFDFSKSYLSYELLGDISSWSNSKLLLILGKDILRRFSAWIAANVVVIDIKTSNKIQKRIEIHLAAGDDDDAQGKAILAQMMA